jgi:VWFA-related protein
MRNGDTERYTPISRRSLLASLLPAATLYAQDGPKPTFTAGVKVVNVFATVRDKKSKIVTDLKQQDFLLEEEGKPQTIRYFTRETDLALTLGLLVDTSMSQRRVLGQERTASYRFLDKVLREEKDLAFVIHFDFETELLQDLTGSKKKLEDALDRLEMPQSSGFGGGRRRGGNGTVMYDAILLASDEIMRKQAGRKALILLTDGVDNGSKVTIGAAIDAAQRADTLVYSILFSDEEGYGRQQQYPMGGGRRGGMGRGGPVGRAPQQARPDGKKILQRISKETGGGFFEVSKKHPIEEVYDRIQEELRNQYSIGYTPDPPPSVGEFRRVKLSTTHKDYMVQSREGYYAAKS